MTDTETTSHDVPSAAKGSAPIFIAALLTVPGILVRFNVIDLGSHPLDALCFGLAIVGAAFMLSWAGEAIQLDVSAGLAIALLALIAVLPEYAVDFVFARKGGNAYEEYGRACQSAADAAAGIENSCGLALANMTGSNRLLIGIGWPAVVFIGWWAMKRKTNREYSGIKLERSHSVELAFLVLATAYSLSLPLKSSLTLLDAAVLVSIFVVYTIRIARAPAEEPHLMGPAAWVGTFTVRHRRFTIAAMFVFAAAVIFMCADRFAEALVTTGIEKGFNQFFLVQWVAPLASETPELLVAGLFAWRLNTNAALGTLVASKVNQWTLLVGTLPIVFAFSSGSFHGLPLDTLQREELLLTAAQSLFAVAVLTNLKLSIKEASMLLGLFLVQFAIAAALAGTDYVALERNVVAAVYLALAAYVFLNNRGDLRKMMKNGLRTPYSELVDAEFDTPHAPAPKA